MKITKIETLQADGGYRICSYIKVSTDEGIVGWAEFYDGFAGVSVVPVIQGFAKSAIGMNPLHYAHVSESLLATTRLASGGLSHQAVAAIENACLDICGKARGVPVHALFGGPFRVFRCIGPIAGAFESVIQRSTKNGAMSLFAI